jgi:hemerythrin-like domain-containing protein
MAKRHQSLVPLSQDHHHGLAVALRLRQGDTALLNDGWTHDRKEQARKVSAFYVNELVDHFRAEEEIVFPAMLNHIPDSLPMIETLIQQHRDIEHLVTDIRSAQEFLLERDLIALGELLDKHIRIEERELFETFQELPAQIAEEVGDKVKRVRRRD